MSELIAVFVTGLLSSAHCIGMCGGFAAAIGTTRQPLGPLIARQIVYCLGRLWTYSFLGACGGFAGLYLSRSSSTLVATQQIFSAAAGTLMILIGTSVLGLPRLRWIQSGVLGGLAASVFTHFFSARSWVGFFLGGLANGFLPCGLVYAFLAVAVATGSVMKGMAVMAAFGLGTVPAMVMIGCGSSVLTHATRIRVYRVAACFVIVAGLVTIKRAFSTSDDHRGEESRLVRHADH